MNNMSTETKQTGLQVKLIGRDGNIFNLLGIVSNELSRAGEGDLGDEVIGRVMSEAKCYEHALGIIQEYIEIV